MTKAVADGAATPEAVRELLAERAPILSAAFTARKDGAPWGEAEAALAADIIALDRRLVDEMWRPRKDVFLWLAARSEKIAIDMPQISALAAITR